MSIIRKIKPIEIPRFFYEIEGLDLWSYDEVIERMGEPYRRETITRPDFINMEEFYFLSDIEVLHYNQVIFFVNAEYGNVIYYDIVGRQYKLWGRKQKQIGVGSTREEVEANSPKLSKTDGPKWKLNQGYARYVKLIEPISMIESEFGFYRVACQTYAEFEFDRNNIVTRIRIGRPE